MKKSIYGAAVLAASMMIPVVGHAKTKTCAEDIAKITYYQVHANNLFAAYHSCKLTEWITHHNCGEIHRHAEDYQKKANHWREKEAKDCKI